MTDDERRPPDEQEFQYWLPGDPKTLDLPPHAWLRDRDGGWLINESDSARLRRFEEHLRGIVAMAIEDLCRELAREYRDQVEAAENAAQRRRLR